MALDLRLFTHRAALEEVIRLRRRSGAEAAPLGPRPLLCLTWLMARFRYLSRLHHIQAPRVLDEQVEAHAAGRTGRDRGRWALRLETVDQTKRVTSARAAMWWNVRTAVARLSGNGLGQWNLWYYAACALGTVMQDPDSERTNDVDVRGTTTAGHGSCSLCTVSSPAGATCGWRWPAPCSTWRV